MTSIVAPMDGRVIEVRVVPGEEVEAGKTLVVIQSGQFDNELKAPRDGTVMSVLFPIGHTVDQNETLVILE